MKKKNYQKVAPMPRRQLFPVGCQVGCQGAKLEAGENIDNITVGPRFTSYLAELYSKISPS